MKCRQCGREFATLKGGKFIEVDPNTHAISLGFGAAPTICRQCILLITPTPKDKPKPEDL